MRQAQFKRKFRHELARSAVMRDIRIDSEFEYDNAPIVLQILSDVLGDYKNSIEANEIAALEAAFDNALQAKVGRGPGKLIDSGVKEAKRIFNKIKTEVQQQADQAEEKAEDKEVQERSAYLPLSGRRQRAEAGITTFSFPPAVRQYGSDRAGDFVQFLIGTLFINPVYHNHAYVERNRFGRDKVRVLTAGYQRSKRQIDSQYRRVLTMRVDFAAEMKEEQEVRYIGDRGRLRRRR